MNFLCFAKRSRTLNRGYSRDVTTTPTHWLGGKRRVTSLRCASDTLAEGNIMGGGGAMQLDRIGTVLRDDETS